MFEDAGLNWLPVIVSHCACQVHRSFLTTKEKNFTSNDFVCRREREGKLLHSVVSSNHICTNPISTTYRMFAFKYVVYAFFATENCSGGECITVHTAFDPCSTINGIILYLFALHMLLSICPSDPNHLETR